MTDTMINKLDFNQVKNEVANRTIGDYSKERLESMTLSSQLSVVENRLTETSEARLIIDSQQHVPFMGLTQMKRLLDEVSRGLNLIPRELIEIADFLRSNRMIAGFFKKNEFQTPLLYRYAQNLPNFESIEIEIYDKITNGKIRDTATSRLRKIRAKLIEVDKEIDLKLTKFLKHKDNAVMLQESLIVKKNNTYTVPIKASYKNKVAGTIIEESGRGHTVFVEPTAIAKLNSQRDMLLAEESMEEYQIIAELSGLISTHEQGISEALEYVTMLDIIFARAKYSREVNGVTPLINKEERLIIKQGRHPFLMNQAVPLDFSIGKDYRGLIITGPNAGGKTLVLKTVGLLTLMTMFGLQIPVAEGTEMAIYDHVFVDIGDQQDMGNALSTFSGHMKNVSSIVARSKRHSLVLLDEIGSGTDPSEGAALAIAIIDCLYQRGATVVATTHYGEVKEFAKGHEDFVPAAMRFDQGTLAPQYLLDIGKTGNSQALWIAEKMKLPIEVLTDAKTYIIKKDYAREKRVFKHAVAQPKAFAILGEDKRFAKGDRVVVVEEAKALLVFEDDGGAEVTLFVDGVMTPYLRKRIKLERPASELYPENYDLDQLFVDYETRKFNRDIDRGSKKALKQLRKDKHSSVD